MIINDNNLFLHLEVDGAELPSSANLVDRIVMAEGNGALTPAIELVLNDYSGHLQDSRALTDGNSIVVTVGKKINDIKNVTRQYRLFGMRQQQSAYGPQIKAIGIYDAPGYLTGSVTESFQGTTSDVFKSIVQKCNLRSYSGPEEFNGRMPNDSQIWRNVCKSRAVFCSDVALHGRIDPHSAMYLALTSLGILKYRNLMDVIETPISKITRTFVHNITDKEKSDSSHVTYLVRQARDRSMSGLINNWQNYGSTRMEHSLSGTHVEHKKVDVKTSSKYLPINGQISKTVERARMDYAPLDCGNVHADYQKALYQNLKLLGLFSEHLSILVYDVTDVQLLDPVIYRQANADPSAPVKNTDVYIVVGKSVIVSGGRWYAERIELCRMSLTTKGETALKTALNEPQSDLRSGAPDVTINPTVNSANTLLPSARSLALTAKGAQDSMNSVKQNIPYVNNSIGATLNSLTNSVAALKSLAAGQLTPAQAVRTLNTMLPSLNQLNTASSSLSTSMTQADASLGTLSTSLNATAVTPIVRQSTLFTPGGIFHTYTASTGMMRQLNTVSSLLGSVANEMNAAGIQNHDAQLSANINTLNTNITTSTNNCNNANARMWNSLLSVITATAKPAKLENNAATYKQVVDSAYAPTTSLAHKTQPLQEAAKTLLAAMTKKTDTHQFKWMPDTVPTHVTPVPLSGTQALLDKANADHAYAQARNTELSPTTWSA